MAKKMDAEAISTALYDLEENTRKATLIEVYEELTGWLDGKNLDQDGRNELPELKAGLQAAADFLRENYGLKV